MKELVIASENKGKIKEIKEVLAELPMEIYPASEKGFTQEIQETGDTLAENALLKAASVAAVLQVPVLADDSGLEVFALNGAPGVFSSRFAGLGAKDDENNQKLLQLLKGVVIKDRKAVFRTVLALVIPGEQEVFFEGCCDGVIAFKSQGDHGFGYDPIFFLPTFGKTMAQLGPDMKNQISHRALALQQLQAYLQENCR